MSKGPLQGIRIVEIEGIGPAPFCGMHLADLGADVVLIERKTKGSDPGSTLPVGILKRGKRSIALDLKDSEDRAVALDLIATADALIEGMRPGVMERLGLGPEVCLGRNPQLVFGRMTGWGQAGPLAQAAGHDINYVSVSSAAWFASPTGTRSLPPPGLVGDIGGGANYLTIGILAGILKARATGEGDVIDAAIVDGSAHMMNLIFDLLPSGMMQAERGRGFLDDSPWYSSYRCADGRDITLGALEPKFYAELLQRLGLTGDPDFEDQYDRDSWSKQSEKFRALFATEPSAYWQDLLEGTDACFGLVESPISAPLHPHNLSRGIFENSQGYVQAVPAPRFQSNVQAIPGPAPEHGQHQQELLKELKTRN